jgi:hypothetical protein
MSQSANEEALLRRAYDAFNARDVEALLRDMADDVDWPDVAGGCRLHGHDEVRRYWEAQFATADPRVKPVGFEHPEPERTIVIVQQTLRDKEGNLLAEGTVRHEYRFRDGKVAGMNVVPV